MSSPFALDRFWRTACFPESDDRRNDTEKKSNEDQQPDQENRQGNSSRDSQSTTSPNRNELDDAARGNRSSTQKQSAHEAPDCRDSPKDPDSQSHDSLRSDFAQPDHHLPTDENTEQQSKQTPKTHRKDASRSIKHDSPDADQPSKDATNPSTNPDKTPSSNKNTDSQSETTAKPRSQNVNPPIESDSPNANCRSSENIPDAKLRGKTKSKLEHAAKTRSEGTSVPIERKYPERDSSDITRQSADTTGTESHATIDNPSSERDETAKTRSSHGSQDPQAERSRRSENHSGEDDSSNVIRQSTYNDPNTELDKTAKTRLSHRNQDPQAERERGSENQSYEDNSLDVTRQSAHDNPSPERDRTPSSSKNNLPSERTIKSSSIETREPIDSHLPNITRRSSDTTASAQLHARTDRKDIEKILRSNSSVAPHTPPLKSQEVAHTQIHLPMKMLDPFAAQGHDPQTAARLNASLHAQPKACVRSAFELTPEQHVLRRSQMAFSRIVAKLAEDIAGWPIDGDDEWNIEALLNRSIDARPLRACQQSRERQALIVLIDISGSCLKHAEFFQRVSAIAASHMDVELMSGNNGRIEAIWKPALSQWLPVRYGRWPFARRTILFFGDHDGEALICDASRRNRVTWFSNEQRPERAYLPKAFHGWYVRCGADTDINRVARGMR